METLKYIYHLTKIAEQHICTKFLQKKMYYSNSKFDFIVNFVDPTNCYHMGIVWFTLLQWNCL